MTVSSAKDSINRFIEKKFSSDIRARFRLDAVEGTYRDFPEGLAGELKDILVNQGITSFYEHQSLAFDLVSAGKDTLIASSTASGKTMSFFVPILNEYLAAAQPFSVLLLYPTKALSRDQENTFAKLMDVVRKRGRLGTYDGDTPRDERERLQRSSDFIITNPDMLHSGILPNHNRNWRFFLSRLRYIVVDEVHIYRGAFGSHVSNVFRRLLRVCRIHGSEPAFVCSSATIGNPAAHSEALFMRPFSVIDRDAAPRPPRDFYFINPPLVTGEGMAPVRKGPASISIPLLVEAATRRVRTICFCRARQEAERLCRAVTDGRPELAALVKPYRGGLLPSERRALEKDLLTGRLSVVISTNALELGIDIGDLDLCVLSGYPGTVASFRQQAGRVGRKNRPATVVFIGKDGPIDQYLIHHHTFITKAPVEQAFLNADNPYILLQHLPCAAQEHPLRPQEELFPGPIYGDALSVLRGEKIVVPYHESFRYALNEIPSRGVNLRGMTDYNVEIYCGTEVVGELDPIGAMGTVYKDAIYHHLGKKYMSLNLDMEQKLCEIAPVDVDYYTEAVWESKVELVDREREEELNEAKLAFGLMDVSKQPKLYKKIMERTYENIGYGPITLPPFRYQTTGFNMLPPVRWVKAMEEADRRYISAAHFGLSYILRHAATFFCMADLKDLETDISLTETAPGEWRSALYLYDAIDGGVGYAENIFDRIAECLALCSEILQSCKCGTGCPGCVPPLPPGVDDRELEEFLIETNASTECTRSLLVALIEGVIRMPVIKKVRHPVHREPAPPDDPERAMAVQRLNRAATILKTKRERVH